jgi:hypothetical protein
MRVFQLNAAAGAGAMLGVGGTMLLMAAAFNLVLPDKHKMW